MTKLDKAIRVSKKTRDRLRSITYATETYDDIINQLMNWAFDTIPEYHTRLQT